MIVPPVNLAEDAYQMPAGILLHEAGKQFAMAEIVRDGWQQALYERGGWFLLLVHAGGPCDEPQRYPWRGNTSTRTGEELMAYSDYGGYGYRNGERVEERSDYTIRPDGTGVGTPGSYPGFAAIAAGVSPEEVRKFASYPHHHVVLGDGPIFIGLHKQSSTLLYRGGERLEELAFLDPACCDAIKEWKRDDGTVQRYVDSDWSINNDKPLIFNIDDHRLEVVYEHMDNYYQYARLTQPDGTVWTGFSGYGVGAGLEDCGYGYDTIACEDRLAELFPPGVKTCGEVKR